MFTHQQDANTWLDRTAYCRKIFGEILNPLKSDPSHEAPGLDKLVVCRSCLFRCLKHCKISDSLSLSVILVPTFINNTTHDNDVGLPLLLIIIKIHAVL